MDLPGGLRSADVDGVAVRRDAVVKRLNDLDPSSGDWELALSAVATAVADAILNADAATLNALAEPLRYSAADLSRGEGHTREMRGFVTGLLGVVHTALQRLPEPADFELARGSQARQMLDALAAGNPLTSAELRARLTTGNSQLSRVGRTLLAAGLVVQRRAGRVAIWEIAPRGRQLLQHDAERRSHAAR